MELTKDELNQITNIRKEIANLHMQIASFEIQQHNCMHRISQFQNELNTIEVRLVQKYGDDVKIDLHTGTITQENTKKK